MPEDRRYCGHCHRYQQASQGEKCISCKRPTVTVGHMWDGNKGREREETSAELESRWKKLYGGR